MCYNPSVFVKQRVNVFVYKLDDYQRAHGCYRRVLELLNPNTQLFDEVSLNATIAMS
jgi:hypothetical protein